MLRILLIVICLAGAGCRGRKATVAATLPKPDPRTSVDLEPGWRLRVITPLIAGGGYKTKFKEVKQQQGNTISLQVGDDFLGFETAYYDVRDGLKVQFTSAELTREGVTSPQVKPIHPLFATRRNMKHVRLVFLERGSSATHDMAVITARNMTTLEQLTAQVRSSPADGCKAGCEWVPAGIAVRAEKQKDGNWVPAH